MKNFELQNPDSLEQAAGALAGPASWAEADALPLAGGQDLLTELKEHLVEPERLVNLKGIPGLRGVGIAPSGEVRIGALTTVAELARNEFLRERCPVLCEAAEGVASPQIRTLATVGGNLCQRPRCWYYRNEQTVCLKKGGTECFSYGGMSKYNAVLGGGPSYIVHPSDLAPALIALDATVRVQGAEEARAMPLQDFFTLPTEGDVTRENVLAPGELVTRVDVPARRGWRSTYLKFMEKDGFDFALSAVALALRMDGGRVAEARLCLGGVAPVPWRCRSTEELLVGRRLDAGTARMAAEDALRGAEPLDHNAYKIPLTQGLVRRALKKLAEA